MRENWWNLASCYGMDTNEFFNYEQAHSRKVPEEVRAICRGCPVKTSCLENALHFPELYGFMAGTTAADRRKLRVKYGISGKKKKGADRG